MSDPIGVYKSDDSPTKGKHEVKILVCDKIKILMNRSILMSA